MTDGKLIHKTWRTQRRNRNIIHFFEHFTHQHNLFIIACFKQHSAGFAFHAVNSQDVDFQHSEHRSDISKQTGSVLMYLVLHIPLFIFH
ncbi:hypothetical protein D3C73_1257960 [compost metagenome]